MNILTFKVQSQVYAIEVSAIETVVRMVAISDVPGVKQHVLGVVDYHGAVIPVIDLSLLYGYERQKLLTSDVLIIINIEDKKFAVIANSLNEIVETPERYISALNDSYVDNKYFSGIVESSGDLILVSNLDEIVTLEDMKVISSVDGRAINE